MSRSSAMLPQVMNTQIAVDREKVAELCRRHGIRKLSLFGSVLRDDFRPDSDVDLLVVWKPDARRNMFQLARVEEEFSEVFGGRKIDLVSEAHVYHRLRDRILSSAEVVYDEG